MKDTFEFFLSYYEHEDEHYVKVNDMITMLQKMAIMSDVDIDKVLDPNDSNPVIPATNLFGKTAVRKITNFAIEALDNLETHFEITKKKIS